MTINDRRIQRLLEVVANLPDQSQAGRNRAYRQLRVALVDELSRLRQTPASEITSIRQELERIVRETEYRISETGVQSAFHNLTSADADAVLAMRDQIQFMEQSEQVRDDRGPQYAVDNTGRLTLVHQIAPASEVAQQRPLHIRLLRTAEETVERLGQAENQYPEMVAVSREYTKALQANTEDLDPINLWSVGNGLAALLESYRSQDVAASLSHPLEPAEMAAIQRLVREHGAFVMGFAAARELIERADQFALNTAMLREIQAPGMRLLDELADNRSLVADDTLRIHRSLRDSAYISGWTVGRAGYTSYLSVRNSISAIIRGSIGTDRSILTWFGLTSVLSTAGGTSEIAVLNEGAAMLLRHGPVLTQFFAHSPEFLSLVNWALSILKQDKDLRDRIA